MHTEPFIAALGAQTGNQAVQMVRAGLNAIYLSGKPFFTVENLLFSSLIKIFEIQFVSITGWQVAADANVAGDMYPDQSLYPANSGPELARKINKALRRADQVKI